MVFRWLRRYPNLTRLLLYLAYRRVECCCVGQPVLALQRSSREEYVPCVSARLITANVYLSRPTCRHIGWVANAQSVVR
ncbi:hypothetical protein EV702DRAFT_1154414 [Suillus placidus]|uniref:Secreted protein n=1 Tax=Suillus placidus TaxID=48579 RepID=A0A9P6ZGN4_9AGAM|nr:hypothetical protein EV702DRAFT_1154414 [Suillus placidus]